MPTIRQFARGCYNLISSHSPTRTLIDDELQMCVDLTNQLLKSYASNGLMITIAHTVSTNVIAGQSELTTGSPDVVPLPTFVIGRMANLDEAWLTLQGVTYPLEYISKAEYLNSWKYQPLQGVPQYIILFPETEVTRLVIYPAPSQGYLFSMRGKFQLPTLDSNSNLDLLPEYYYLYLKFAVAKQLAFETGRAEAWTPKLEAELVNLRDVMESASEMDLSIEAGIDNMLNGAFRVRAGI